MALADFELADKRPRCKRGTTPISGDSWRNIATSLKIPRQGSERNGLIATVEDGTVAVTSKEPTSLGNLSVQSSTDSAELVDLLSGTQ
jgi:hypothetical protein